MKGGNTSAETNTEIIRASTARAVRLRGAIIDPINKPEEIYKIVLEELARKARQCVRHTTALYRSRRLRDRALRCLLILAKR